MNHEQHDPTPALDLVVDQAIKPRVVYLCGVVAELLGRAPTDNRVLLAVASIHGQCLIHLKSPVAARILPGALAEQFDVDALADHVTEFSLAGLRAMVVPGRGFGDPPDGGGLDDAPNGPYIIPAD